MPQLTTAGALLVAAVLLGQAAYALRLAALSRRLHQARVRWYRATVSAAAYGLPTPGRVEDWPGVAELEQRLQRTHPHRVVLTLLALFGLGLWLTAA